MTKPLRIVLISGIPEPLQRCQKKPGRETRGNVPAAKYKVFRGRASKADGSQGRDDDMPSGESHIEVAPYPRSGRSRFAGPPLPSSGSSASLTSILRCRKSLLENTSSELVK